MALNIFVTANCKGNQTITLHCSLKSSEMHPKLVQKSQQHQEKTFQNSQALHQTIQKTQKITKKARGVTRSVPKGPCGTT